MNNIMTRKVNQKRDSSIELLRIIIMMGTIFLHYNNADIGGGFRYVKEGSINLYYLFFTTNIFVCAVDVFIIISGYYLSQTEKRKFIRVIELIIQVIFFNYINLFRTNSIITVRSLIGCLLPKNYYVILYSVLYLISPYINLLMKKISKSTLRKLMGSCILIFSVYTIIVDYLEKCIGVPLLGLSSVGANGSSAGYTIVNFILVYMVGAYIRINDITIEKKKAITRIIILVFTLNIITLTEYFYGKSYGVVWNYNNPLIILLAGYLLIFFKQISINSKIINELAKSAFTCYMYHCMVLEYFNIELAVNGTLFYLILHQVIVVIVLYILSYIIYRIYDYLMCPIINLLIPLSIKVDRLLLEDIE